jgi:hypothetical protein
MFLCLTCHRHVRENVCPFCGAAQTGAPLPGPRAFRVGMKRSAILAGAVAAAMGTGLVAASTVSCSSSSGDQPDVITGGDAYGIPLDAPNDVIAADAAYGIPFDASLDVISGGDAYGIPLDAPNDSPLDSPNDAPNDVIAVDAAYGIPHDAGSD